MTDPSAATAAALPETILLAADETMPAPLPIWPVGGADDIGALKLEARQMAWLEAQQFKPTAGRVVLLPSREGHVAGAVIGLGHGAAADPAGPPSLQAGVLPRQLPPGRYALMGALAEQELAAVAWGLGSYAFQRYKSNDDAPGQPAQLVLSANLDRSRVLALVESVWLGRDLINTPACDMGPAELEAAAKSLAQRHNAGVTATVGDELLVNKLPLIHAVGRASQRAPRLIELTWQHPLGRPDAPKVTLVGKGVCFDTGGLDIKPASGMLLMKKDMAGAATVLSLAAMIMRLGLDLRLRVLIPAVENAISGNAYRPRDVIRSRDGRTVEIGNTDAEGRLVLSDALCLADEDEPDAILTFSTLTGAARVALGPELPPFFTDDDAMAAAISTAGNAVGDPVWRMPLWPGYERTLDSDVADMGNVADSPFAGSIVAALFLRRFVRRTRRFAHFDIYGWRPTKWPLGPKGGEPQAARTMLNVLSQLFG